MSVLELNKKLENIYASRLPKIHPIHGHEMKAQDPRMAELARKQQFAKGIKPIITNQFNFVNIENPFQNSDFTLSNLKDKRHK